MEVAGKRRRGRPKRRWFALSERELSREEAQDRVIWRGRLIRLPHMKVGKDAEEVCVNMNRK